MNEESVWIHDSLQGVYLKADSEIRENQYLNRANDESPVFIMINAGYLHSVGPYRLYVDLARGLGTEGFDSFRFDLAGRGDSADALHQWHKPAESESTTNEPTVIAENGSLEQVGVQLQLVMDTLSERYGVRNYVLCGLCSGADDALVLARVDPRVIGCVLIDSAGFRTKSFYFHHLFRHYPRRVFSVRKWRSYFLKILSRSRANKVQSAPYRGDAFDGSANDGYRAAINPAYFTQSLSLLIAKNCKTLFIYTGGVSHYYNHSAQFSHMVGNIEIPDSINVMYLPLADHLLFVTESRERLIVNTVEWACNNLKITDSSGDVPIVSDDHDDLSDQREAA